MKNLKILNEAARPKPRYSALEFVQGLIIYGIVLFLSLQILRAVL